MKYEKALERALSPAGVNSDILLPGKKDLYEISYMGGYGDARNFVFGFSPEAKSDLPTWFTDIKKAQGDAKTVSKNTPLFSGSDTSGHTLSTNEIAVLLGEKSKKTDDA
jgi:hypothetical protein